MDASRECMDYQRYVDQAIRDHRRVYLRAFGFQPIKENSASSAMMRRVELKLSERYGWASNDDAHELEDAGRLALENPDFLYLPHTSIGCLGYLVKKVTGRIIPIGSIFLRAETYVWAYYRGISLNEEGKDRKNNLVIRDICDKKQTIEVLCAFLNTSYVWGTLIPKFDSLPLSIENVDLVFGVPDLRRAEENRWFSFEITQCRPDICNGF